MQHRVVRLWFVAVVSLVWMGCTGAGDSKGGQPDASTPATQAGSGSSGARHFGAPAVAPIVRDATPSALQPTAALGVVRGLKNMLALLSPVAAVRAQPMADVNASIRALFKDVYNKISGGQAQGLINSSLEDLDNRMSFVDMVPSSSACMNATPKPFRINLSSVSPAIDMTLHLQCNSGTLMAFGHDDDVSDADAGADADAGVIAAHGPAYSLWLYLASMTDPGAFGYFANVYDAGAQDESVDFLFLENHPMLSRIQAYRVKAQPSTKRFEFVYGATDGGGASGENLRCGFKMVSNGKYVWAVGKDHQPGVSCADSPAFTRCLSASDLTEQASSAPCASLRRAFTMEAPSADALAKAGSDVSAVLPVTTASSVTLPF